jgi:hypothetical protein
MEEANTAAAPHREKGLVTFVSNNVFTQVSAQDLECPMTFSVIAIAKPASKAANQPK